MSIAELIKARRTVQVFNDHPVAEDLVRQALDLALWAPNHKLTFPWRFVIVGEKARRELADISVALKEKKKGSLSETEKLAIKKSFMTPSHLVILAMKKASDPETQKEDYAAVAAGVQNAQLFLWEKGIGTKWGTGGITRHETTYRLAGMNPASEEIVGFFWIGNFDMEPKIPGRPSLDEVMRKIP